MRASRKLRRLISININLLYYSVFLYLNSTDVFQKLFLSMCIYLWLYSPYGTSPLFQFLNLHTVSRTPWTGDQSVARPLPAHRTTQTQNKRTQTSMPRVGFEPMIPAFERVKTCHALDHAATVVGLSLYIKVNLSLLKELYGMKTYGREEV
jgi:hypothetical protein